jgi:hypothetical protein
VSVRLGKPQYNATKDQYECSYEIAGAGASISRLSTGLDAFQALQLAFVMIGAEIAALEQRSDIALRFNDLGSAGFPQP